MCGDSKMYRDSNMCDIPGRRLACGRRPGSEEPPLDRSSGGSSDVSRAREGYAVTSSRRTGRFSRQLRVQATARRSVS